MYPAKRKDLTRCRHQSHTGDGQKSDTTQKHLKAAVFKIHKIIGTHIQSYYLSFGDTPIRFFPEVAPQMF